MSWKKRFLFLGGQLGMMMLARYFFQWIIAFTSLPPGRTLDTGEAALFSGAAVGTLLLLFRIFDGVTDPLAGALGDYWARIGEKRKSLLAFSAGLPALGLLLCFGPTPAMPGQWRWFVLVCGFFLFFVGYTIYAIPYWSLLEEYSGGDETERTRLSNLLGFGLLTATGIGFVVTPALVEKFGYFEAALAIALPGTLLMLLPYFAEPSAPHAELRPAGEPSVNLVAAFKLALQHRRYIAFLLLFSGTQMALTIMTAAAPIIAIKLLGGTEADVAKLMGPFLGTALISFAVVPRLARAFGWERLVRYAAFFLSIAFGSMVVLGRPLIVDPLTTAMVLFSAGGPMIAVMLGIEGEAIASCAKERGGSYVGIYFGFFNFVVKTLNGVAIFLVGFLTELSNTETGTTGVRTMVLSAAACVLLGLTASLIAGAGAGRQAAKP